MRVLNASMGDDQGIYIRGWFIMAKLVHRFDT